MSQRQHILEVALERFAHQGIAATTIQDVADHAGVSKASVLYHFSSKDQLVDNALAPGLEALEELVQSMAGTGISHPRTREEFLNRFVDFLIDYRLATHIVVAHPYLAQESASLRHAHSLMSTMAQLVGEQTEGDDDRLRFGVAVSGATYALVSSGLLGVDSLDADALRSGLRDVLHRMLMPHPVEVTS